MDFRQLNIENDDMDFDIDEIGDEEEEQAYKDFDEYNNYDSDPNNNNNRNNSPEIRDNHDLGDFEPCKGMEFESEQSARVFYNSYARRLGFSTRLSSYNRSRHDGSVICRQIVCHRQGFRRPPKSEVHRHRTITRVGCKAEINFRRQPSGRWVVIKFVREHNHELVPSNKVHSLRSHRHISGHARSLIDTLQAAGMGPSKIMSALIKESGGVDNVGFTKVDCQNYMCGNKQKNLGNGSSLILDYLKHKKAENPEFFFAVQGDFGNSSGNIFWVDAKARLNYKYFGDTVTFDTMYRIGRYRVPFASFTGLNQHGQPLLLGCALIVNESESSFVWLFQTWLSSMSGRHPVSITTDKDMIIRSAIARVFPETRHRFCKWNVFTEALEKLSHVYSTYPSFETELHKCVNSTETIEEFESCWENLVERYQLRDNEWLQSMHSSRQQWAPVYLRDTFFGEMLTTQSNDATDSFFDSYINASTSIYMLIKQYEKAIASRHEKEVKADFETVNTAPALRTPSPMEKQAADLYTKKIFMKFQEQFIETLVNHATVKEDTGSEITYIVAKYGEDHKAHTVHFDVFEKKARCSCQMFEFSGIPCRHILAVFRVLNVLTLPSHYVLQRWTRNAKSAVPPVHLESSNDRYVKLRQEAIKFVEEGADSTYVYTVALEAIREAAEKVASAKQHVRDVMQGTMANGNSTGDRSGQPQSYSMDKKVEELTLELETTNRRCEAFRSKLLAVMKDMEEQKLQISVKVQNERLNFRN